MRFRSLYAVALSLAVHAAIAQAPAAAPANSTGQCNDGSYTSTATKRGACHGHQGIKTWFASVNSGTTPPAAATPPPAAAPSAPSQPAQAPTSTRPASNSSTTTATTRTPAAGGAPGLVWLNSSTNVYHCYGSRYYGTTKAGKYISEADAKAAGAHADHGKACSQ